MTMPAPRKLPLTVVGGFLGAGKTTLLNRLLARGGARYAVLVNDFGAINIDAGLIAAHDGATMTLTNGCVCCSIGTAFIETLGRVLDRAGDFDHMLIEASGVGDPWRIAEIALVDPALVLNAVVVVADAARIAGLVDDAKVGQTVRQQFAQADVVLLNKADLAAAAALDDARAAVAALRPGIAIVPAVHGDAGLELLAARAAGSAFRALAPAAEHEEAFRRWCYSRDGVFDAAALASALAALPPQLLRLKGACAIAGQAGPRLLQLVDRRWSLSEGGTAPTTSAITLVGIGTRDLPPAAELDRILDGALAAAVPAGGNQPERQRRLPTSNFDLPEQGMRRCS